MSDVGRVFSISASQPTRFLPILRVSGRQQVKPHDHKNGKMQVKEEKKKKTFISTEGT